VNKKISWKVALAVVGAAIAVCGYVYSQLPTGMVVHMTAKNGPSGPGAPAAMKPNPELMKKLAGSKNAPSPKGLPNKEPDAKKPSTVSSGSLKSGSPNPDAPH
jgi:hypothetical protein